jgi:hypothetical protein
LVTRIAGSAPYGEKFIVRGRYSLPFVKHPHSSRVALAVDLPAEGMRRGDVATVVERHPAPTPASEPGYSVEVFSAVGDTVAVLTVPESHLEPLRSDEVLTVRSLAARAS